MGRCYVRTEVVLTSTHNLCFRAKIRKIMLTVNSCKPQFYYMKVGCNGVYITWTCYHDEYVIVSREAKTQKKKKKKVDTDPAASVVSQA